MAEAGLLLWPLLKLESLRPTSVKLVNATGDPAHVQLFNFFGSLTFSAAVDDCHARFCSQRSKLLLLALQVHMDGVQALDVFFCQKPHGSAVVFSGGVANARNASWHVVFAMLFSHRMLIK